MFNYSVLRSSQKILNHYLKFLFYYFMALPHCPLSRKNFYIYEIRKRICHNYLTIYFAGVGYDLPKGILWTSKTPFHVRVGTAIALAFRLKLLRRTRSGIMLYFFTQKWTYLSKRPCKEYVKSENLIMTSR